MIQRVMPELMGLKNIVVLNDEAHHCYREKVREDDDEEDLKGEEKDEAKKNNEAARLWISGLEAVKRKLGMQAIYDLSATPFFLRGSGYAEGTLFHWTVSDFSLMDSIECGIVKLPRIPVADNIASGDMPTFRNLWDHIGRDTCATNRLVSSQDGQTFCRRIVRHYDQQVPVALPTSTSLRTAPKKVDRLGPEYWTMRLRRGRSACSSAAGGRARSF